MQGLVLSLNFAAVRLIGLSSLQRSSEMTASLMVEALLKSACSLVPCSLIGEFCLLGLAELALAGLDS